MSLPTEELTCQELVELITAYLEDVLPAPDRTRFEAHLAECPYCRTYLNQMGQTIRFLGRLTEQELAPEVKRELLQRFRDWKTESS
jgi:anti-sigma factor RsiW